MHVPPPVSSIHSRGLPTVGAAVHLTATHKKTAKIIPQHLDPHMRLITAPGFRYRLRRSQFHCLSSRAIESIYSSLAIDDLLKAVQQLARHLNSILLNSNTIENAFPSTRSSISNWSTTHTSFRGGASISSSRRESFRL